MEFPGHRSREVAVPALLAVVLLQVEHTPEDLEPSWMGYSVGKWQGDTLAVESARFNGKTRLDTLDVNPSTPLVLGCSILVEQCPPAKSAYGEHGFVDAL